MIKKILVLLDGSKNSFRGLDVAIVIAKKSYAAITGLYVTSLSSPTTDAQKEYIKKYLLKNANKFMKKAKVRTKEKGILFYDKILYGQKGSKIVKFAHTNNFDLIVVGSRGMGSVKETLLGSTSNYVLHKSNKPVLIVK